MIKLLLDNIKPALRVMHALNFSLSGCEMWWKPEIAATSY